MKTRFLFFTALCAAPALAGDLRDVHFDIVPRTAEEAARIGAVSALAADFSAAEPFEAMQGGAGTVRARDNADAFSQSSANIGYEGELDFKVGNGLFRKIWVSAPASTWHRTGSGRSTMRAPARTAT
jgi:CxxC motif-containing protein (DUF1111 family)